MIIMDEKQLIEQMDYFVAAYEDSYDEAALDFISENYLEYYKKGIRIDIIDQALVAIDLLPDDVNLYKRYLEFLKERYENNYNFPYYYVDDFDIYKIKRKVIQSLRYTLGFFLILLFDIIFTRRNL